MPRIAIAGFQHETNTFGATQAHFRDFEMADSWPGLLTGAAVLSGTDGSNLPLAGFAAAARADASVTLVPLIWCAAEPSAPVTDAAFDRVSGMILDGLGAAGDLDGIYLDLHGAMVTDSHQDSEGALLARIRDLVGPDMPIALSLDLHANLTRQIVDLASAITIFRTYPHLDMAQTGGRAFAALAHLIAGGRLWAALRQAPFLVPLHAQYTGAEPCLGLYGHLETIPPGRGVAEIAMGFPAADIADCGPSVLAYADDAAAAAEIADDVLTRLCAAEPRFEIGLHPAPDAVRLALDETTPGPVVIADVQDNPGAGATSDTTGLLRALHEAGASNTVLGLLHDPEMAAQAHRAGVGQRLSGALGGHAPLPDNPPFSGDFIVERMSAGIVPYLGEMYGGGDAFIGPSALLRLAAPGCDIRVIVTSIRNQALDRGYLVHFDIDPAACRIIALKSTVQFPSLIPI